MSLHFISAPSPNFDERRAAIDTLVLHYTGMADGASALARLCAAEAQVSAHYLVEEDGRIFSLVDEARRAWHAGRASWMGEHNLNCRSIGIEIVNGGHDFALPDFPDVQIEAVIRLCQDILERRSVPASRIVGHSDIAPDRKRDPGEKFPWKLLAQAGIGLWPEESKNVTLSALSDEQTPGALAQIGYRTGPDMLDETTRHAICAFQRRFLPEALGRDGSSDQATRCCIGQVAQLAEEGYDRV